MWGSIPKDRSEALWRHIPLPALGIKLPLKKWFIYYEMNKIGLSENNQILGILYQPTTVSTIGIKHDLVATESLIVFDLEQKADKNVRVRKKTIS